MAWTVPFGKTNGPSKNAKWFLVCYTNSKKNVITAEGDLCPFKSFRYLCKYSKGLCSSLCGGNRSYHSVKAVSVFPLSRLKSLSRAVLKQGHLKEQSIHEKQMEASRRPLANSPSSKGHIYFYFPRHRLEENCNRAAWRAHGKYQLAWGTPGFCYRGICGHPKWQVSWQMFNTSGSCAASTRLPNLLTDLRRRQQYGLSWSSFTLSPCSLFGLSGTVLLPLSLRCCRVPLHLHSNL